MKSKYGYTRVRWHTRSSHYVFPQEAQEDILKRLKDAGLIYSLTKSR